MSEGENEESMNGELSRTSRVRRGSGLCRRGLAWRSVACAELRLGDVSQGALDLLEQHVTAINHLLQASCGVVVLLLQLPQTGRLTRGNASFKEVDILYID